MSYKVRPEVLLLSDSGKVKRSKLMGCGIKPKSGKESSLTALIIDFVQRDFIDYLKEFKLEELFKDPQEIEKLMLKREELFGKPLDAEEFFDIDSISISYLGKISVMVEDKFGDFISNSFTENEIELLGKAFKFEIYSILAEHEFKDFFSKFLNFQLPKEPYKNWFTQKDGLLIMRSNIEVRELKDYSMHTYMLPVLKRHNVVNSILEEVEDYLSELFFMDIEIKNEEDVELMKNMIKNKRNPED